MTILNRNPENQNIALPNKYKLMIPKITTFTFFVQSVNIPKITANPVTQTSPFKDIPRPTDKLVFGDLNVSFLIAEDFWNYQILSDWIRGYSFPCSFAEYQRLNRDSLVSMVAKQPQYSDGYLEVLSNLNNVKLKVKFINMFPIYLSDINFDVEQSPDQPIKGTAAFSFHTYILDRCSIT